MEPELLELAGMETKPEADFSDLAIDITGPQSVVLPQSVVEERAHKANLGLGDDSPGLDQIKAAIDRGDEHLARTDSANALRIKESDNRREMLRGLAGSQFPGAPISQDDADLATALTIEPVVDPATVWEKAYGTYLTNRLITNTDDPDGAVNKGLIENPAENFAKLDIARDLIAKNEIINKRAAEAEAAWKEMGFWDSVGAVASTIVPFRSNLNITNTELFSKKAITDIPLAGNTIREQVTALHGIANPDVFAATFNEIVDRLMNTNVLDAMDFIGAVKGYSLTEQFVKNVFSVADVADVGGLTYALGKGLVKVGSKIGGKTLTKADVETAKALTDTVKATTGPQVPSTVAAKVGMTNESAALKIVTKHTGETADGTVVDVQKQVDALFDQMPTVSRPSSILDDSADAALPNSQATRISTVLENNAQKFVDTIVNSVNPERLTPEALAAAIRTTKIELKRGFAHLNDAVLDVVDNGRDPFTNTYSLSVRLGTPHGETFTSSADAHLWARDIYNLPEGSYLPGQQGTAFYIDVTKPLVETAQGVQDRMITTNNATPIPNMLGAVIQGFRTPAEIFSSLQKANRDASLMANTKFGEFLSDIAKPIGALTKSQRKDLQRIMEQNRDYIDPVDGLRGRYYENVADLEQGYREALKRMPKPEEVEAYFTAVQINEMDWALRNFTAYRDLSRQGIEDFQVRIGYSGYSEYGAPRFQTTGKFKAKEVDSIPWSNPDMLPVALLDETGTGAQVFYRGSPDADRQMLETLIKERGYKIIQVARPQERILKDTADIRDPIQYIVTKGHTKSPLEFHQVDRSPGFHVEYADPYYLKQPRVSIMTGGSRMYEGDATLWSFQTRAQAKKFEDRVNALREAIRREEKDLNPYIQGKLPEDANWWKRQFAEDGHFNLDQTFRVVARGQSSRDIDPAIKQLRDLTDDRTTLTSEMDRKFQGERSQQLLSPVEGTEENPLIRLKNSPLIDPLSTTSRGIGQAARSRYFGDMKISTAEQFIKEFGDLMDLTPQELARSPMAYLHNPPWRKGAEADTARFAAAKAIHKTTLEFLGQQTPFGNHLQALEDKVLDTIYSKYGSNAAESLRTTQDFVNSRDPLSFFRKWAFRAKMGFLNPQQLLVQAQGLAHMTAIAPRQAVQSMAGATYSRYMMLNSSDEIVKGAAQKLKPLGWKAEQFEESHRLMESTGWNHIGKESTYRDDMSDPKVYEGTVGKWLDKGAIFFTEGERLVRMAGWHAAYREWREVNPTKVITNRNVGEILSRADTLTLNMTNASKASWERGVLSIPAQFQSYGIRMLEQLWGGQLTTAEKARVLGLNSVLYGVPVGLSGVVGYPLYEDVRTMALERGINVSDTYMSSMLEGIPAVLATMLGAGELNVGQRLGPGGVSFLKDYFSGEKTTAEMALGPAGSVVTDIFLSAIPAGGAALAKMLKGEAYEPEVQDLIDAARTISTVNAIDRVYMAATIGKYISRKGTVLSDATPMEAIISAVTGLQTRDFTDAMLFNRSIKDFEAHKREIAQEAQKHVSRAWIEASNNNQQAAEAYMVKARAQIILGDFTASEKTKIFENAFRGKNSNLMSKFQKDWIFKAPPSQRMDRAKQMEKTN